MPKKTLLLLTLLCLARLTKAQTADQIYDQYVDFNEVRSKGNPGAAINKAQAILPNVDKLPPKARIVFYNGLGKAYEDRNLFDRAIPYYEMVAAAVPDFYVVHRALGYIYVEATKTIGDKMQAEKAGNATWKQLMADYKKAALKALPHLEKAQACDPSDETLALIKLLYRNIGDKAGLESLPARLAGMSKKCIDVVSE